MLVSLRCCFAALSDVLGGTQRPALAGEQKFGLQGDAEACPMTSSAEMSSRKAS